MIDQVLNDLINEIALEGEQGCTFEELFTFVENLIKKSLESTPLNKPVCFDINYKAYLWTHLRKVDQLIFTENGVILNPFSLTLQEIQLKSQSSQFVIKASEDSQDRNIYGSLKTEKKGLTDKHKLVLSTIAKSRYQGISQYKLGEILGMDSKTVFYFVKKLDNLGLIVKESAYIAKMNTRILLLKRFAKQHNEKEDDNNNNDINMELYRVGDFKINIIKHLTEAKDNMMTLQDIIKAMGFVITRHINWARIKIYQLHQQGIIEKFIAFDGKRQKPSVRLPKEVKDTIMVDSIPIKEEISHTESTTKGTESLFRDLPSDYQFYQDIVRSGERGLVRQDLADKYPDIDPKILTLFLNDVTSPPATEALAKYLVYRTEELDGKNRLFRYFAWDGWKKFNENLGKEVTQPRVKSKIIEPKLVEPPSIDYIGKSFEVLPSTKTPIKRLQVKKEKKQNLSNSSDKEEDSPPVRRTKKAKNKQTDDQSKAQQQSDPNSAPKTKRVTRQRATRQQVQHNQEIQIVFQQQSGPNPGLEIEQVIQEHIDSIEPLPEQEQEQKPTQKPISCGKSIIDYFKKRKLTEPLSTSTEEPTSVVSTSVPLETTSLNKSTQDSLDQSSIEPQTNKRKLDDDTYTEDQAIYRFVDGNAPVVRHNTKKSKRASSDLNSTKLRRYKILIDMMEEQHIRELNTEIVKEFNKIEMATSGGQKMAVVTFNKMAKQLHVEKKLKVYVSTIQKLYGLTEIKTFLLHSSLIPESEEVKDFIKNYCLEKPIESARGKRKDFKTIDVEELPTTQEIEKFEPKVENPAAYYGWIRSKWIRARKLHVNLMLHYFNSKRKDNVIDMTEFTKKMPIKVLTSLCSNLPYFEEEFKEFLDTEENRNILLCELPENIQTLIFQNKAKIRSVISLLIRVLEALGVIESINNVELDKFIIAPKYKLSKEGIVRDYAFKDRAIINTLPLKSIQDIHRFWDELYSACIHPNRERTEKDEKELLESIDKDDPLYYIYNRRGWSVQTILTPKQKELLNSFVDFETKTIPSDNLALRIHLSKETGLSTTRIRRYYHGIIGALNKMEMREAKQKALEQRQSEKNSDPTINDLMLVSYEKRKVDAAVQKAKEFGPFIRSTFVGSRRFRKLRLRTEPGQDQSHTDNGRSRRLFKEFSRNERDLLLYSYCIMKTRAKRLKFFWGPITTLLTNKTKEQCRRVLNTMISHEPELNITIERLKTRWEKYYQQGIESKEIEDVNTWDTCNFDLRSHVEYFIRKMIEDEAQSGAVPKCVLPRHYEDLIKYCRVVRDDQRIIEVKKVTYDQGLSVNAFNDDIHDTSDVIIRSENDDIIVGLVKTLIKMLLVTPDNSYDATKAYKLMSQYPSNIIETALEDLRSDGLIIKDNSRYDRIPGRAFNVSEKYLKLAEGVIPFGLIDNARVHYDTIASNEILDLRNLNNGIAASTLDLLSQGKIMLDIKQRDAFLKQKESLYYPKSSAVKLLTSYVFKNLDLVIKRISILPMYEDENKPKYLDAKITIPSSYPIKKYLQKLQSEDELVNIVYEAVKYFKINGASFNDIVTHIKDDYDIHHICNTIDNLIHHEPPLIRIVGFKQLRYVCAEFCSVWFLKGINKNYLLNPLMWNDISGNIIDFALDGCAKAVISHILVQPGISHNNLFKKFENFFSEYELYTLMRYLIEKDIVISRKVQRKIQSKKVSIFEKRQIISLPQNTNLINSNEITFYWLSSDYYLLK